jgi:uncharacterized protein YjbI with pentapeptide repeats
MVATREGVHGVRIENKSLPASLRTLGSMAADLSILRRCDLIGVTANAVRLADVDLESCSIAGGLWRGAALSRVAFVSCRMSGWQAPEALLGHVTFRHCKMDRIALRAGRRIRASFIECDLSGADFVASDLRRCEFIDCELSGVQLSQARLEGVDLRGCRLSGVGGLERLSGAVLDPLQVEILAPELARAVGIVISTEERSHGGEAKVETRARRHLVGTGDGSG